MSDKIIIAGKKPKGAIRNVSLDGIIGKTVVAIEQGTVEGADGKEPCITLIFSDGTKHGFVIARDVI
jgi:hypothetical protein